jgi:hypothetical protein
MNPYESTMPETDSDGNVADPRHRGFLGSTWDATKRGVRASAVVGGAIALVPAAAITAFGLANGHGWGGPTFYLRGLAFCVSLSVLGGAIGAMLGLAGAVFRRVLGLVRLRSADAAPGEQSCAQAAGGSPSGTSSARRKNRSALWTWLLFAPAIVAVASALVCGASCGRMTDRQSAAAVDAADRDNTNWRWNDLLAHRVQVPDPENAALVIDEALLRLRDSWLASSLQMLEGEPGTLRGQLKEDLKQLGSAPANARLSDSAAERLGVELAAHDEAVQIARRLAGYERGWREVKIDQVVLQAPLRETTEVRMVARLLVIDAALRARGGDLDGALDSCRAILGACRSIGDEPFLFALMVRSAVGGVGLDSTRRVLAHGEPSEGPLERLRAAVRDELARPLLLIAMNGERAALTERIRRVRAGLAPVSALRDSFNSKTDPRILPHPSAPWAGVWFDYQEATTLDWMNQAVAIARRPVAEQARAWKAWDEHARQVKERRFGKYVAMLPLFFSPAIVAGGTAFLRYQSELGATVVLIAAERHRRKTGKWPSAIAEIDRSILSDAPVDPYSGQPFRMEHRDGQLFVYSIGPNGQDEHGDYNPKLWPKLGHDDVGAHAWDVSLRGQTP